MDIGKIRQKFYCMRGHILLGVPEKEYRNFEKLLSPCARWVTSRHKNIISENLVLHHGGMEIIVTPIIEGDFFSDRIFESLKENIFYEFFKQKIKQLERE